MLPRVVKRVTSPILKFLAKRYLSRDHRYQYQGIPIHVLKGVFHPGLFFSTKILLGYLNRQPMEGQTFLELGAGTGLISITASKQGASVTASDISTLSIRNLEINVQINDVPVTVIQSDLFDSIPLLKYDWIVVNPPYYPADPEGDQERAWFCGRDFQFFRGFFDHLGEYTNTGSKVVMILSEDCDIDTISQIASGHGFNLIQVLKASGWYETNYIFSISPAAGPVARGFAIGH